MESYFPIKIKYTDTDEIFIINTPEDIVSGRGFIVLATKVVRCHS